MNYQIPNPTAHTAFQIVVCETIESEGHTAFVRADGHFQIKLAPVPLATEEADEMCGTIGAALVRNLNEVFPLEGDPHFEHFVGIGGTDALLTISERALPRSLEEMDELRIAAGLTRSEAATEIVEAHGYDAFVRTDANQKSKHTRLRQRSSTQPRGRASANTWEPSRSASERPARRAGGSRSTSTSVVSERLSSST
jgi:hypothetical protein